VAWQKVITGTTECYQNATLSYSHLLNYQPVTSYQQRFQIRSRSVIKIIRCNTNKLSVETYFRPKPIRP